MKKTKTLLSEGVSKKAKMAIASIAVGTLSIGSIVSTAGYAGSVSATINSLLNTIQAALESIYTGLLAIVTILAVVICAWCFCVKMFSKNPRSIDEANQWMKRVAIAWLCFMLLSVLVKIGLDIVTDSGANTSTPWDAAAPAAPVTP